ncbi:MAG TPA: hypothetical protein VMT21_00290, partial [Gemmatimonadales bacterium]|nr:hypothetical protein [Gemmatimonadales bacterium]
MRRAMLLGAALGLALGILPASRAAARQAAGGGTPNSSGHATATPPPLAVAAHRRGPITIDGKLDEPDWQAGAPAKDFR